MVTDRVSTAGLCGVLAMLYPEDAFVFIMLIVLDIFSHWFVMVNAATAGKHHKDNHGNFILKWYYGCYPIFAYCCLSQEFYYLARYASRSWCFNIFWAVNCTKFLIMVFLWCIVSWILRFVPDASRLSWMTTYIFLPGCTLKQIVNVSQWWNAASSLAAADRDEAKTK